MRQSQGICQLQEATSCQHIFFDVNHDGDTDTRQSQTRILSFFNIAPKIRFSKSQNSDEASIFGSEFTAMNIAVEILETFR